jgi:hypothetical protein
MTVSVGQPAPNIILATLDGQPVPLAQAWQAGQPALLVFLRHLG